jgi:hypothetical protein
MPGLLAKADSRYGHGKVKSPRTCTARIDVEHPVLFLAQRLVRVAAHDHGESGGCWLQIQRLYIVQDINQRRARFRDCCVRQVGAPGAGIHVAFHRDHGCESAVAPGFLGHPRHRRG